MHVLFFDIDGTLINTGGSGMESLRLACTDVFACPPPKVISTAGRTDRGIARELFQTHRVEDSADNWHRFRTVYIRHLREQLPRRPGCVLPGVSDALERLAARPDVALGLLTGNVSEGARLKLEYFGLDHHFAFGGYGEVAPERNGVAEHALVAARQALGGAISLNRVWVLGDTLLDIECARHIGAKAVAVATGMQAKHELAQARPDVLLDDFCQAAEFWRQLDEAVAA